MENDVKIRRISTLVSPSSPRRRQSDGTINATLNEQQNKSLLSPRRPTPCRPRFIVIEADLGSISRNSVVAGSLMTGVAPTYIYDRSQYTFERNEFVLSLERCVDIFGNLRSSASRSLISGSPVVWLINLQKDEVILEETEVRRLQISSFWTFGAFENTVKRIIIQEK
ncbi:hypothetical protein BofuT4_P129070.1 [Botrytis cinerea T4]|uniref:Uncharacterized protein n=1 Tax=Botryotinia fuckeliana (strain T4) TaxID=999810 RepID=G2YRF9_BOTF4|nr:hypothetical protein BofuT4_P129070.1 [Botrytis cinerea T4]